MTPAEKAAFGGRSGVAAQIATVDGSSSLASSQPKTVLTGWLIFAVALAVRVAFFSIQVMHSPQSWSRGAPFGQAEMGSIAVNLAAGRGFSSPFGPGSRPTAWLCPLIPMLWALVIKIIGGASGFAARIVIYIGAIPSAAAVVVYWLIAQHVLRGSPALRRTALLTAVLFCLWPESLYGISLGWYYTWQELATAAMVLLGMRWLDHPGARTVVPLGITCGVLSLINVTPLPIFAVLLFLPVLGNRQARKRMLGLGIAGAAIGLLIATPWIIRNAVVFHAFVPMRSVGGYQLYAGNNPDGNVRDCKTERHPLYERQEMHRYRNLGEIAYSAQSFHEAIAYIRAHPIVTLKRAGERAYVIWLSDATDHWSWDGRTRYWEQGAPAIGRALATIPAAWGLAILMVWALLSGRFALLPYKGLFFSVLFLIPLPYYLTIADYDYTELLRSWLLLVAILVFSGDFRRPPAAARSKQPKTEKPQARS